MSVDMGSAGGSQVYDMFLASAFFVVVLSPLAINAGLNLAERLAQKREAARAQTEARTARWLKGRGLGRWGGGQFRSAICSVTIWVRSGFLRPWTSSLNLSTLLDQFMEQNFGPHIEQKAASL